MRDFNTDLSLPLSALYDEHDAQRTQTWRGHFCWKNPIDLLEYAAIVYEIRPTLIIETGTHSGGSALWWRDMMLLVSGRGHVISVDTHPQKGLPEERDIVFVRGSSTDTRVISEIENSLVSNDVVLVNLYSDHSASHVTDELDIYSKYVTMGSYLIVEDGCDDFRASKCGPFTACSAWLPYHPEFEVDTSRERLGTNNPSGYLRRC